MKQLLKDASRRQVLKGAGGFSLALPFLPSLASKAGAATTPQKRLVWITTNHGGCFESSFFPKQSMLSRRVALYPDHEVKAGPLVATDEGGKTALSPVLRASSGDLTPALLAKMNVMHGLDVPYYLAHHTGGHLGNMARNDGNGSDGAAIQVYTRPTIDQIMAWSRSFYGDLAGIRERSIAVGTDTVSYSFSSPKAQTGGIQAIRGTASSQEVFDRIFAVPNAEDPGRLKVVDRVVESYKQLRNSNKRLSGEDKQRLDDHVARIAELERKLGAQPAAACSRVSKPTDDANNYLKESAEDALKQADLLSEVIVAAFMCGSTRIATWGWGETGRLVSPPSVEGGWHAGVAHQWIEPPKQDLLARSYQKFFESVFVRLAKRLDIEEAEGRTYLDNTLLVWSQECGMVTHEQTSIPVLTFGSAGGAMQTGQYLDYRRTEAPMSSFDTKADNNYKQTLGVLYNQWLANVLQFMGLSRKEYELWSHPGYGVPFIGENPNYRSHYGANVLDSRYQNDASNFLPFLKKA